MDCAVARTLDLVGERWALLILMQSLRGVYRFEELQKRLGIGRATLARRLDELVEAGLLERVRYEEHPPRFEYRPTAKGRDLAPVIAAVLEWGNRWTRDDGPTQYLTHQGCGDDISALVTCSDCGEPLTADRLRIRRRRPEAVVS